MSADATNRADEHAPEVPSRWRLHRGGIVNIWQYAEHTFDLSGGRAIFQGTNGSGKSRTLELLLPLCLDGELRQIGSKGHDTVSIRRLMLDEYVAGPNRIGYAWIELRREIPGGDEEFLTCGIGVKASKTSQSISDSWRFVTTERVGYGLHLVGPDEIPLSQAQLRERLGADCVLDDQAFRARIAAVVYGVPAARYGDLLHLQRTLRNPDVGLKVLEGQLEQILSDALPPLDPSLIERLATSFDDLESIRENIVRLTGADKALSAFLTTYSDYALGSLRDRADSMRTADNRLRELRKELANLQQQAETTKGDREKAEYRITELETREGELESSIDALRSHPAYLELQNLRDREKLVESARDAAVTALDTASKHRAQEDRSAESVVAIMRRLSGDATAATQACGESASQLTTAGLDGSLAPRLPELPSAELKTSPALVRAAPESGTAPLEVTRREPPQLDTDELVSAFRGAATTAQHAGTVARQRAALTLSLHQQAVDLDEQNNAVAELHRQARQAQRTATEAAARRNQAEQELSDAAAVWIEHAQSWAANWPMSTVDGPMPEVPAADVLVKDRGASRQTRERIRAWARPQLHAARRRATEIEQELSELQTQRQQREDELAQLRSGGEHSPQRPEWASAERDPASGAAFYRLVDFQPSLSDSERAGVEAALQSSGLLTAWVSSDGTTDPRAYDVFAAPGEGVSSGSLADFLLPAPEPDAVVAEHRIAALLGSIPAGGDGALSLAPDGSWRAGVLSGRWHKDAAEFVGAGAREAARARRIAELEDQLEQLRSLIGDAQRRHHEATEAVTQLEAYLDSYPDDGDLLTAHAKLATATETAQDAERKATETRQQHEQARQRWQVAKSELDRAAAEAGLPAETRKLDEAYRAATAARAAIDGLRETIEYRCLATLYELRDASLHHDAAIADRMEAESQAEQRCSEFTEQASALTELTDAVGGEAQEISGKVTSLERERADLRKELPQCRENVMKLRESVARLESQQETKDGQLSGRIADAENATEAFRRVLHIPGIWAAAAVTGDSEPSGEADSSTPPAEMATAVEMLGATTGRKGSTEATVLNRLQTLQQALAGNYDISAGERHGVLTVTVTGEEGAQPVAGAAARVSEQLAQQRGFLNERYQTIFADYLIRDLAERLRGQITVAEDLCKRMNAVLDGARSSQGVHVQLDWQPSAALTEDVRQAIELVRTPFASRSDDQDALLRKVFTDLIESERDSTSGGYAEILSRALDYRGWYTFTVRVRDTSADGKPRVRRLRQLSSGETRLISYVTLFAAAAAFYDAVSVSHGDQGPLRLVLLDEAFERLDDPTIARMLGLLVDLDMDWLITWPSGWGVSPKIPKMHIYDVLRPRSGHGIACTHTTWNGHGLEKTG